MNPVLPTLASDNYAGVHSEVMEALVRVNQGPAPAYGGDSATTDLQNVLRGLFQSDEVHALPVFNGTGANITALASVLRPYESVLCSEVAHIAVDECGAVERATGCRLVTLPTMNGKLTHEVLKPALLRMGDVHHAQPRVISVSQSTEYGTVYSFDELRALADFAHGNGLLLHVDGARAANAVASLNGSFHDAFVRTGVDVLSLGGTKNGAMAAEAVVYFRKELAEKAGFFRKQSTQLSSKQRFISAQLLALFSGDLWLRNANHANGLARRLADGISLFPGVKITQSPDANTVFVQLPREVAERLQQRYSFYSWNEVKSEYRLMTSFATDPATVDGFLQAMAETLS